MNLQYDYDHCCCDEMINLLLALFIQYNHCSLCLYIIIRSHSGKQTFVTISCGLFLNEVVQFYSQHYFHLRYLLKLTLCFSLSIGSSTSRTSLPLSRVLMPKQLFSSKIGIIGLTRATSYGSIRLPARL